MTGDAVPLCSFCLQPRTADRVLVAGVGIYICSHCVTECVSLLHDRTGDDEEAGVRVSIWAAMQKAELLEALPTMARISRQVEDALTALVSRLRTMAATWAEIGEALGVSRQRAWQRFAGAVSASDRGSTEPVSPSSIRGS